MTSEIETGYLIEIFLIRCIRSHSHINCYDLFFSSSAIKCNISLFPLMFFKAMNRAGFQLEASESEDIFHMFYIYQFKDFILT